MHLMETLDLSFNHIQSYHEDNVKNMQAWRTKWIHNGTHLSPTDQRKGIQVSRIIVVCGSAIQIYVQAM